MDHIQRLRQLLQFPRETECAEFKVNNTAPESIGSNISALANSSGLMKAPFGYIVWGVTDEEHEVVGTDFDPHAAKKGNEPLLSWLATQLRPSVDFRVHEVDLDGNHVVYMEIPAASHTPIRFQDLEHIRVGPTTRKLRDFPEKERALWATSETFRLSGSTLNSLIRHRRRLRPSILRRI